MPEPCSICQSESEKRQKMKGNEGWWRVKFDLSLSNPLCLSAFRAYRWRVKGFCVIHFYKYWCSKNAYLRHICAQRRAQMCLSKSNYTEKEVKFVTTALSKPQCDTGMLGAYFVEFRRTKRRKADIETKKIPAAHKWNHRETPLSGRWRIRTADPLLVRQML